MAPSAAAFKEATIFCDHKDSLLLDTPGYIKTKSFKTTKFLIEIIKKIITKIIISPLFIERVTTKPKSYYWKRRPEWNWTPCWVQKLLINNFLLLLALRDLHKINYVFWGICVANHWDLETFAQSKVSKVSAKLQTNTKLILIFKRLTKLESI